MNINLNSEAFASDYNVNTYGNSEHNNIHIAEFSNQFMLNGFTKPITKPRRIFHDKKSLLDNMYTTLSIHIDTCQQGIILSDFSDHFTIYAIFSKTISTTQNNYRNRSFYDDQYLHRLYATLTNRLE